ncbi:MAG: hypothetical protein ACOYXR_06670 [Nitrospirota bacterium]
MTPVQRAIAVTAMMGLALASAAQAHQKGWPGKRLSQTFPDAAKFTSRQVTLSADQLGRIEQAIGERVEPENRTPTFYPAFNTAGEKIGFVLFTDQAGENGPIEIGVAVGSEGAVRRVAVLSSREDKRIVKDDFLDQFRGKTVKDPLTVGTDVTPVAGAETASRALAIGVRKALLIAREAFGERIP